MEQVATVTSGATFQINNTKLYVPVVNLPMFVLSFKNGNDDPKRDSFHKYCMPLAEIKDFNVLIDNKPFFDQPVKKTRGV